MAQQDEIETAAAPRADFGIFLQAGTRGGMGPADLIAAALSLLWLVMVGGFFLFAGSGTDGALGNLMVLLAIFLPVAMIWLAAITLRSARALREETQRLQATVDAMRQAYVSRAQSGLSNASVEKRLDEIAAAAQKAESAIALFTSRRDVDKVQASADHKAALITPGAPGPDEKQPALALGTPPGAEALPVSVADFIKSLNFPDNANDKEGFRALRRALEDHALSRLVRAAQDVLTLLSQDGIYMDDLRPDRARPELWRRFAKGERGRTIAALGGVRDRSSLALAAARMRQDQIFRDATHHFLRQFDKTFTEFEGNAADIDIIALSDTRTARAFMLLGRVTGMFD